MDFKSKTVAQLREFLNQYNGATLSGNKKELIKRAEDFYNTYGAAENYDSGLNEIVRSLEEKRQIFESSDLNWKNIAELNRRDIPENLSSFRPELAHQKSHYQV